MSWTLEQFAAACQHALTDDPGPAGRKKVCEIVQEVLKDEAFVAKHVGDDVPERKILYEDPKLAFSPTSTPARRRATRTITARPGRSTVRPAVRP
jgi:hypothetical protein